MDGNFRVLTFTRSGFSEVDTDFIVATPDNRIVAAVRAIDLDPIKVKLMDAKEEPGWDRETVDRVEEQYRQFLILAVTHGSIVPTKPIDAFWHAHILDTRKYADDCEQAFGRFLHHFPYFGMRGEEDRKNLEIEFARTLRLAEAIFGSESRWDIANSHAVNGQEAPICSTDCVEGNCTPVPSCESIATETGPRRTGVAAVDPYRRPTLAA